MNDRCDSVLESLQNPAYRSTLAQRFSRFAISSVRNLAASDELLIQSAHWIRISVTAARALLQSSGSIRMIRATVDP